MTNSSQLVVSGSDMYTFWSIISSEGHPPPPILFFSSGKVLVMLNMVAVLSTRSQSKETMEENEPMLTTTEVKPE